MPNNIVIENCIKDMIHQMPYLLLDDDTGHIEDAFCLLENGIQLDNWFDHQLIVNIASCLCKDKVSFAIN